MVSTTVRKITWKEKVTMKSSLIARLGTISGMATAAVACSNSADAAVYSQVVGQTLSTTSTISLSAANLDPSFSPNFLVNFRQSNGLSGDRYLWAPGTPMDFINDGINNPYRFGPNVLISAVQAINIWSRAQSVQNTANDIQYQWGAVGDTGFAGIRFVAGADFYYGWIEMTRLAGGSIRVDSWALESSSNTPIFTADRGGAVPEPASAGIFALAAGAAGVRALRRRSLKNASV